MITRPQAPRRAPRLAILCACATLSACNDPEAAAPADSWGYEEPYDPSRWGILDEAWAACKGAGGMQTPVDIVGAVPDPDLTPILVAYEEEPRPLVINNGHTLEVEFEPGQIATLGDEDYQLAQFHFHAPSEHTVEGRKYAAELHMVHVSLADPMQRAVLGVLLDEGAAHPVFDLVWERVPEVGGERELDVGIDPTDLFPPDDDYFHYPGSLTTPPCTEGLTWFVHKTPATISPDQLERMLGEFGENARPVQPLEDRTIAEFASP